jgi:hypothetical protein
MLKGETGVRRLVVELNATEISKLISICNAEIAREEVTLRIPNISDSVRESSIKSINNLWKIKTKLDNAKRNNIRERDLDG